MAKATLTISSKNNSSWSLRGWLLTRMSGLEFGEELVPIDDPANRAELLLLSPSVLVPKLSHEGVTVWDTLAIGAYLNEIRPAVGLLPADRAARARCRSICGEMHSGFSNLGSALPMNLKGSHAGFKLWSGAKADIDRIVAIWRDCVSTWQGPDFFGSRPCMADAMSAPVVTRFLTYDVALDAGCDAYAERIMAPPDMVARVEAAKAEPDEIREPAVEF